MLKPDASGLCVAVLVVVLGGGFVTSGTSHAVAMEQVARFTAWDALPGDGFGWSVALDSEYVLVGAPIPGGVPGPGSAYLYDQHTGLPMHALIPSDASTADRFGSAVALGADVAVVGASFGGSDNSALAGAAYVFDIGSGSLMHKLTPPDSEALDRFGSAVAVEGANVVVGAWADNTAAGVDAGSAYVFDSISGDFKRKLSPLDALPDAGFGVAVALDGTTALIGAPHDSKAAFRAGAAYSFDVTDGRQVFRLSPDDPVEGARFGASVAARSGLALVGAPAGESNGAAYVFDLATGTQRLRLAASDGATGDRFGVSVAIGQDIAIVGATLGATDASSLAGAVYVFDLDTGLELAKLTASDTQAIDFFGGSVAAHGQATAVGAYGLNTTAGVDAGSAYLFDLSTGPALAGDLDGDGFVGIADLNALLVHWNQAVTAGETGLGDATGDGFVGIEDLNLVLSQWNAGTPPQAGTLTSTPESTSASILLIMSYTIFQRHARRHVRTFK